MQQVRLSQLRDGLTAPAVHTALAWGAGCLVAFAVGRAVVLDPMPLSALYAVGAIGLAAVAVALTRGMSLPVIFLGGVVLAGGMADLPRQILVGPVTGLALATIAFVGVGLIMWSFRPAFTRVGAGVLTPILMFLLLGATSLVWNAPEEAGMQNLLVVLAFVLIALVAAGQVRDRPEVAARLSNSFGVASLIAVTVYAGSVLVWGPGTSVVFGARAFALFGLLAMARGLARWRYGNPTGLVMSLTLMTLIILSMSRLALVVGLGLFPLSRITSRARAVDLLRLVTMVGLAAIAIYWLIGSIAPIRERFVEGDVVSVGGAISVNVEGRDNFWSTTWDSFVESPWIGKGAGSARTLLVEATDFEHPHNDYLRLLHDYGVVGTSLFLAGLLGMLARTWNAWRREDRGGRYAQFHLTAFLGLVALALAMVTDNPLAYMFFMGPLAVLIGISLGLSARPREHVEPVGPKRVGRAAP